MSEEFPYVVGRGTGSNLDLEDLLRSLLNCYYFESVHSDKVMGKKHICLGDEYICVSIIQHFTGCYL